MVINGEHCVNVSGMDILFFKPVYVSTQNLQKNARTKWTQTGFTLKPAQDNFLLLPWRSALSPILKQDSCVCFWVFAWFLYMTLMPAILHCCLWQFYKHNQHLYHCACSNFSLKTHVQLTNGQDYVLYLWNKLWSHRKPIYEIYHYP